MSTLTPLLLAVLPATTPDATRIDALVIAALKAWDVPGAALVIVTPDKVVHLKGYGVREQGGKPVTADTVFPLASCTKAITTAVVARLADEGKLGWDDPVRKHLPDFHLSDPAAAALVTLRDLGAHRTGVGPHDLLWYRAPWSQDEMIRRVGKLPLSRPFRTELQYQSVMFVALGNAAAKAGGKPWADLVRELLLDPLGMNGVTLTTTAVAKQPDRAAGHRPNKDGKLIVVPWYEQPEPNPAGSANASARDLAPWLQFQLNGGRHGADQLVTEAALRETQSPQIVVRMTDEARALSPETQQISYALGWMVRDYRGHLQVMHAGLIDGFRAHLTLLPKDGYAFAILANREGTRMNLAVSDALTDLLLGLPAKDWNRYLLGVQADAERTAAVQARQAELARQRDPRPPGAPPDKLAGEYAEPAYGTAAIRAGKDGLAWEWGAWKVPLEHYAGDTFRMRAEGNSYLDGRLIRFVIEDGEPREFRLEGMAFRRVGK
jgi:CubicO group peptidase (beta-lactamase class C family)